MNVRQIWRCIGAWCAKHRGVYVISQQKQKPEFCLKEERVLNFSTSAISNRSKKDEKTKFSVFLEKGKYPKVF